MHGLACSQYFFLSNILVFKTNHRCAFLLGESQIFLIFFSKMIFQTIFEGLYIETFGIIVFLVFFYMKYFGCLNHLQVFVILGELQIFLIFFQISHLFRFLPYLGLNCSWGLNCSQYFFISYILVFETTCRCFFLLGDLQIFFSNMSFYLFQTIFEGL